MPYTIDPSRDVALDVDGDVKEDTVPAGVELATAVARKTELRDAHVELHPEREFPQKLDLIDLAVYDRGQSRRRFGRR